MRHRRSTLPELEEIALLSQRRQRVEDGLRDAKVLINDLSQEQRRADHEVEQVKSRRERDRARLDSGQVSAPKDIERMQHEMESLERRITTLEDAELEVMERLEEAQMTAADLEEELAGLTEQLEALSVARDHKVSELDDELASVASQRGPLVERLPEELVTLYERLRGQKGGVGAAALRARACEGCRLTLDHAELDRIARLAAEEVVRCEECSRILVRTAESGL